MMQIAFLMPAALLALGSLAVAFATFAEPDHHDHELTESEKVAAVAISMILMVAALSCSYAAAAWG